MADQEDVQDGLYAQKQLKSPSRLIRFSHQSRFDLARQVVKPYAGARLLDYGCGDATFLCQVSDLFPGAVGTDVDRPQLDDCAVRTRGKAIAYGYIEDLRKEARRFDVVTCMETLEHCVDAAVDEAIEDFTRFTVPGGVLVVSVPIEIGPTLLAKQMVRRVSGWRKIGDYQYSERYTLSELLRMTFAGRNTEIERVAYPGDLLAHGEGHGHKGFNWKRLWQKLERKFVLRETLFSPFNWSRGLLSSQAWFIGGPR